MIKNEFFFMGNGKKSILGKKVSHENAYDDASYNYDYEDNNDSHVILTKLVKKGSSVLDVGCATGILGKFMFENVTQKIDAIEMDKEAIKIAKEKKVYNNIYNFAIDDGSDENKAFFNNSTKYDYIVLADVLEHIINPHKVIIELTKKLKKDGKLLISIPNVSNIDIIKGLFNSEFNYRDTGLLDVTHFRFFTVNSFIDMINNINDSYGLNLKAKYISSTYVKVEYMDYKAIKEFLEDRYKDLEIIQNIFEISICDKMVKNKYINKKDTMDFIEDKIIKRNQTINSQREEIECLTNELNELKEKYDELNATYLNIVNSKRYKVISSILFTKKK